MDLAVRGSLGICSGLLEGVSVGDRRRRDLHGLRLKEFEADAVVQILLCESEVLLARNVQH